LYAAGSNLATAGSAETATAVLVALVAEALGALVVELFAEQAESSRMAAETAAIDEALNDMVKPFRRQIY
jgi:hypothetical protein